MKREYSTFNICMTVYCHGTLWSSVGAGVTVAFLCRMSDDDEEERVGLTDAGELDQSNCDVWADSSLW